MLPSPHPFALPLAHLGLEGLQLAGVLPAALVRPRLALGLLHPLVQVDPLIPVHRTLGVVVVVGGLGRRKMEL